MSIMLCGQSEIDEICFTLMVSIEGTATGEPDRLRKSFYQEFNLYYVSEDGLHEWSCEDYVSDVKEGKRISHSKTDQLAQIRESSKVITNKKKLVIKSVTCFNSGIINIALAKINNINVYTKK